MTWTSLLNQSVIINVLLVISNHSEIRCNWTSLIIFNIFRFQILFTPVKLQFFKFFCSKLHIFFDIRSYI